MIAKSLRGRRHSGFRFCWGISGVCGLDQVPVLECLVVNVDLVRLVGVCHCV